MFDASSTFHRITDGNEYLFQAKDDVSFIFIVLFLTKHSFILEFISVSLSITNTISILGP